MWRTGVREGDVTVHQGLAVLLLIVVVLLIAAVWAPALCGTQLFQPVLRGPQPGHGPAALGP